MNSKSEKIDIQAHLKIIFYQYVYQNIEKILNIESPEKTMKL